MSEVDKESSIRSLRPDANHIEWVSSGDVNDVAVVDELETFRFPRNEEGRQQLVYEFEVLKLLEGKLSLSVPKPIELSSDKSFAVVSYIPGRTLKEAGILALSQDSQEAIGETIAQFIIELNDNVSPDDVAKLQPLRPEMENWDDWYNSMAKVAEQGSAYATIFADYLKRFKQAYPSGLSNGRTIIHDDLHAGNLIFDDAHKVVGVIDFGDATLGDVHRELRSVYRMGEYVFESAVRTLEPKFGAIDLEIVRLCAVVHELAVLVEHEAAGTPDSRRANFANSLLDIWLGNDWRSK